MYYVPALVLRSSSNFQKKVPMGILDLPTPSPGPSGTSMSSKTPERDFDDRCSLDKLPDDRS